MRCYIYRSSTKEGLYVYLADENGLDKLPATVSSQLGTAEFSMSLDLHPDRKLGQENATTVIENLKSQGFHLQMPRDIEHHLRAISLKTTLIRQKK